MIAAAQPSSVAPAESAGPQAAQAARAYVVFYDGSCGLCRRSRSLLEWLGPGVPMHFVDVNDRDALARWPQIDPQAAQEQVFVLDGQGRLHSGYDAAVTLLAGRLRLVRWLLPLLRWAPVRWVGQWVYHWVSKHRHEISRLVFGDAR